MYLTKRDLSEMRENAKCANSDLSIALDHIEYLHKKIELLFGAIKHGDDAHQTWLKKEIHNHFHNNSGVGVVSECVALHEWSDWIMDQMRMGEERRRCRKCGEIEARPLPGYS